MRFLKTLLIVLTFVAALLFLLQNSAELSQHISFTIDSYMEGLVWTSSPVPLFVALIVAFFVGSLFALSFLGIERVRLGRALRRSRKETRKLQQEVNDLRKITLSGNAPQ